MRGGAAITFFVISRREVAPVDIISVLMLMVSFGINMRLSCPIKIKVTPSCACTGLRGSYLPIMRLASLDGVRSIMTVPCFCMRSEEHTSELQSRFDLVCRLLLEKKKKKGIIHLYYCVL